MGVDLPVDLLIWNLKLSFLSTRCQYRGINLPLDLPMCTVTSILHVHLGKYKLSVEIFYSHLGHVLGMFHGCQDVSWGVKSDITLQCWLAVYYSNYSEIKENSHLFLKNPKWLPNTSRNIYPIMEFWGVKSASWSAYMKPEIAILGH